ncbi:MAG: type I-C CRISPR-associated endonuclease Cas1c [Gemmatimonadaceae bacterium]
MIRHLNTLFVTTQGAYLTKDGEGVAVRVDGDVRLRIPLLNLGSIACFGRVSCSPGLMGACAESGIAISFLSEHGRFLASVHGFTSGNVLLRREQYRRADDAASTNAIARIIVAAKIANARTVMLRAARDYQSSAGRQALEDCSARLGQIASQARGTESTEVVRGMEGESAALYFGVFNHLITAQREHFALNGRNRRPPLDPVNALLSFVYTMLTHDARGACEAAGLDPAVGFLHRDRPGRPSLALDLIEEFRPVLADRLVLSLINRQQIRPEGFQVLESGGVIMDDATRKTVITTYQERKRDEITHPFLGEPTTVGLLPHLQARLLARHLRGDLDGYPAFIWK